MIPERLSRKEDCASDQKHKFVFKKQKTLLNIVVQDASGKPLAGKEYKLEIEGRDEYAWPLDIGDLDPVGETIGNR